MVSVESHHDVLGSLDDSMGSKNPNYAMDPSQFFDYNQVSDSFPSFPSYDMSHLSQSGIEYNALHLGLGEINYSPMDSSPIYSTRPFSPMDSITPHMTRLSPPHLSASELSGDGGTGGAHSSHRSSTGSPDSNRGGSALPPSHGRTPSAGSNNIRYNPVPTSLRTRAVKKRSTKLDESDDEDEDADFQPSPVADSSKREEIRKQRIESEQRRRDELREGYRRLKDALPSSNQKSSKVSLLDRAVQHIRYMEMTRSSLQVRLNAAEMETQRLRQVNEALMLGTAEQRAAAAAASAAVQAQVQSSY